MHLCKLKKNTPQAVVKNKKTQTINIYIYFVTQKTYPPPLFLRPRTETPNTPHTHALFYSLSLYTIASLNTHCNDMVHMDNMMQISFYHGRRY